MILLVLLALIGLAVAIRFAVPAVRRRRLARELRGDWWPRFERDFRAYAEKFRSARESEWRGPS
jgi:hypothetical protein